MIVRAIAPTRLSLFGGGTDVGEYCNRYGGMTISMAINLRQKFTLWTEDDVLKRSEENEVPKGCSLDFVYAFRDEFGINSMHHSKFVSECDEIIESGIGSSATAAVAMVAAIARSQN